MNQKRCPNCGFSRIWKLRRNKSKCQRCRHEFSVRTYPVTGFRLTVEEWKNIITVFLTLQTVRAVARTCNMGQRQAQTAIHLLRVNMAEEKIPLFDGPVELDETYIGAQRKNQKLHIRKRYPPKRGHGTQKLPIFGIFDRATGKVFVDVMTKKLDRKYIIQVVQTYVQQKAFIYTDGFPTYNTLPKYGYHHEFVDHNSKEYVRGTIHTNNMEGFWGIMKRKMGCKGGMQRARLIFFAKEFVWRFNHRHETIERQTQVLLDLFLQKK